mgnify:CR=1 FL=1
MSHDSEEFDDVAEMLNALESKWSSSIVPRDKFSEFTGGLLHPRTLANYDSRGEGPAGKMRFGKKVFYPLDSVLDWLRNRIEISE